MTLCGCGPAPKCGCQDTRFLSLTRHAPGPYGCMYKYKMIRRLSILAFALSFIGNSISDASPHLDGEGGCPMACCIAAHGDGASSLGPKLCCKVDCKQPAGTRVSSTAGVACATRSVSPRITPDADPGVIHYLSQTRFPNSPTRYLSGSCRRFLETGTLLI